MPRSVSSDVMFSRLSAELDQAEAFARDILEEQLERIPAMALAVFKRSHEREPFPFTLYTPQNIDVSVMADLRESLRVAGRQLGESSDVKPKCVLSMLEIVSTELDFWLGKGFFPRDEVPSSFIGKDLALFTAAAETGEVVRRLSLLVSSPVSRRRQRQLGQSVQVQMSGEGCEVDAFWQQFKIAHKRRLA